MNPIGLPDTCQTIQKTTLSRRSGTTFRVSFSEGECTKHQNSAALQIMAASFAFNQFAEQFLDLGFGISQRNAALCGDLIHPPITVPRALMA